MPKYNNILKLSLFSFLFFLFYYLFIPPVLAAIPTAIPTFNSIGLYWSPTGGSSSIACQVQYKPTGTSTWQNGLNLWYAAGIGNEYRGSLVNLKFGTTYEIKLTAGSTTETITTATWNENFPIGETVTVPYSTNMLTITQSGTPTAYRLYVPAATGNSSNINVNKTANYNIFVKASYIIIRGFKLTGGKYGGIYINNSSGSGTFRDPNDPHDIVIENNEIWNWGSGVGENSNMEGAITAGAHYSDPNPKIQRLIIQRNNIHSPTYDTNSWCEIKETFSYDSGCENHPAGQQGIVLFNTGGQHVIRYNTIWSDNTHYLNDVIGAGANSLYEDLTSADDVGFPGPNSDIYGNKLSNGWDDCIEADGDGKNVRIWGNYMTNCLDGISVAPVMKGPVYIWRNVSNVMEKYPDNYNAGGFIKMEQSMASTVGKVYIFHNTTLQPNGVANAIYNDDTKNAETRNNIFQLQTSSRKVFTGATSTTNNFNYDLYNGVLTGAYSGAEPNGISGSPTYVSGSSVTSGFFLAASSKGYRQGTPLNNFNNETSGTIDIGAYQIGESPMEFGVNAYLGSTPTPTPTPPTHCSPLGDIDCSGKINALDLAYLISKWGSADAKANLDNSVSVDALDLKLLLTNYVIPK